jgi:hypothetical protein
LPQVLSGSAVQTPWGSIPPTVTGAHSPARPARLQLTHGPLQFTLQQTPSAQNAESHSLAAVHTAPSGFFPHERSLHSRPSHWLLLSHTSKQRPVAGLQL